MAHKIAVKILNVKWWEGASCMLNISHFDYNYSHLYVYHSRGCYLSCRCDFRHCGANCYYLSSNDHQLLLEYRVL